MKTVAELPLGVAAALAQPDSEVSQLSLMFVEAGASGSSARGEDGFNGQALAVCDHPGARSRQSVEPVVKSDASSTVRRETVDQTSRRQSSQPALCQLDVAEVKSRELSGRCVAEQPEIPQDRFVAFGEPDCRVSVGHCIEMLPGTGPAGNYQPLNLLRDGWSGSRSAMH